MAKFIPPTSPDEVVLVQLDRVWGSQHSKTAGAIFRPTRSALEMLEFCIARNSDQLTEMPNIGTGASPTAIAVAGAPVPEGSHLVAANALLDPNEPFTAPWLGRDLDTNCAVTDFLSATNSGLCRFDFNGYYTLQASPMATTSGTMWLTPIRNLVDVCPDSEADRQRDAARGKFMEYISYRSGFWANRTIPLGVLGQGSLPQPDNRMADGTPVEDWIHYDCNNRELVLSAV